MKMLMEIGDGDDEDNLELCVCVCISDMYFCEVGDHKTCALGLEI